MSDLLASLAARAIGTRAVVRPRINPLFAVETPQPLAPPDLWWREPANPSPPTSARTPGLPTPDRAPVPTALPVIEDPADPERPFSRIAAETTPGQMRSLVQAPDESIDAPHATSLIRRSADAPPKPTPPAHELTDNGLTVLDRPSPNSTDRFQPGVHSGRDTSYRAADDTSTSRPRPRGRASLPSHSFSDRPDLRTAEPPRITDDALGEPDRHEQTTSNLMAEVKIDVETPTLANRLTAASSTDHASTIAHAEPMTPRSREHADPASPRQRSLTTISRRPSIDPGNEPAVEQPVRVTIGRLDVRLNRETRPTPPAPRPAPTRQTLSLDDYLRQRNGAGR